MTITSADIAALVDDQLSRTRTVALVVLAGVGLVEGTLVATMVVTEPEPLPVATTVGLAAVAVAGYAWALFAVWRLRTRRVLLLRDRVVGASMAMLFTTVAWIGGLAVATTRGEAAAALTVGVVGTAGVVCAATLLRRAVVAHRRAVGRLRELEVLSTGSG